MANLGTLTCSVPQTGRLYTALAVASTSTAVLAVRYLSQRRPVAWWRGGVYLSATTTAILNNFQPDYTGLLSFPDNGRLAGITEQNLQPYGLVKVAVFYYPTMTLIGWVRSAASDAFTFGYLGVTGGIGPLQLPVALDTTDLKNYAVVAFDPARSFNLVGFDDLSAVT